MGDLRLRIIQQATSYQILNAVDASRVEYNKFMDVLKDVSTRLGKTFSLSKDQTVRIIASSTGYILTTTPTGSAHHASQKSYI